MKPQGFAANTSVPAARTRQEIETLLQKHKCTRYMTGVDYTSGSARVQFHLNERIVRFTVSLPDQTKRDWEQVERQRWRQLLLVIKAKLEVVAFNIATFDEEFMAYVVLPGDVTAADVFVPLIAEAYGSGHLPQRLLLPSKTEK